MGLILFREYKKAYTICMLMYIFLFFVLGLIVGSFLNVLVYRLKDAETLLGRSFCRHCKNQIRWYDNIPLVSFVLLGGTCRDCQGKISWQYPALEFLTGGAFVLVGYLLFSGMSALTTGMWLELTWLLVIVSLLLAIAAYDLRYMEIPIVLLIISFFFTAFFLLLSYQIELSFLENRLGMGLLGGLVVAAFFFVLVFVSKETWMGWGDVWLGGVVGMIVGLPLVLFMLTLSFGVGALYGILAVLSGKKEMKSQVPFAPFLVVGTLLTFFLPQIFPEYTRLFLL